MKLKGVGARVCVLLVVLGWGGQQGGGTGQGWLWEREGVCGLHC